MLYLVLQPLVASCGAVLSGEEAKGPEAVVEGDQHHVLLQQVAGAEEEAGAAAHDVGTAVEVHLHTVGSGGGKGGQGRGRARRQADQVKLVTVQKAIERVQRGKNLCLYGWNLMNLVVLVMSGWETFAVLQKIKTTANIRRAGEKHPLLLIVGVFQTGQLGRRQPDSPSLPSSWSPVWGCRR